MTSFIANIAIVCALLAAEGARAQPAIAPPQLGFVEDSAHALRPAYGLAGNFILGPRMTGEVVAEAFSGSIGLLKTDSSLVAFDAQGKLLGSKDVAPGPAIFAFASGGATALAYLAANKELVEWRGDAFAPSSFPDQESMAGTVVAIAFPSPVEVTLFVERKDTIWELRFPLDAAGARSQKALLGVHAPLLALPTGDLIYAERGAIVVRRADASEVRIAAPLPESFSLQQMNQSWVQLIDFNSDARFAIQTAPGREGFYRLPEQSK